MLQRKKERQSKREKKKLRQETNTAGEQFDQVCRREHKSGVTTGRRTDVSDRKGKKYSESYNSKTCTGDHRGWREGI